MGTPPFCVHRPNKRKWWKALYIIDMKVVDGKRLWRIAWSGYDDEGEPWEPSWEPTMNVSGDLIEAFTADRKGGLSRALCSTVRVAALVQLWLAWASAALRAGLCASVGVRGLSRGSVRSRRTENRRARPTGWRARVGAGRRRRATFRVAWRRLAFGACGVL